MEVTDITFRGGDSPQDARRWVQNHARVCNTEKNWDQLLEESFKPGMIKDLVVKGHHSPFDHIGLSFYFNGLEKALAMILNNQGVYTTCEKSARYTIMDNIPKNQKQLYQKWDEWFLGEISRTFPSSKFPTLYISPRKNEKTPAEKLAQENARYVTSVFTPTRMTHSVSWRQINILYHWFSDFVKNNENTSDEYVSRLASSMKTFLEFPEIKKWIIEEAQVRMKGDISLRFFKKKPVEEHFGEDEYSTNYLVSFASLAHLQRHRLGVYTVSDGWKKGAPLGFYVPDLIDISGKKEEWLKDMYSVSQTDFPQAQLIFAGERGMREHLPAKTEERECCLTQLETTRVVAKMLDKYSKVVPTIKDLINPPCLKYGCRKGGCSLGPNLFLERLI